MSTRFDIYVIIFVYLSESLLIRTIQFEEISSTTPVDSYVRQLN